MALIKSCHCGGETLGTVVKHSVRDSTTFQWHQLETFLSPLPSSFRAIMHSGLGLLTRTTMPDTKCLLTSSFDHDRLILINKTAMIFSFDYPTGNICKPECSLSCDSR